YGVENWPKYLHLQALHRVLLDNERFITGNPVPEQQQLGKSREANARVYGSTQHGKEYLAFLVNSDAHRNLTVEFDGLEIELHRWSVTVVRKLSGEKQATVLYNTAKLAPEVRDAQANPAGFQSIAGKVLKTDNVRELSVGLPLSQDMSVHADRPLEHISVTDDRTDYLWYRTTVSNPCVNQLLADGHKLELRDAGDVAFAFIDGQPLGMRYGRQDSLATFTFDVPKDVFLNDTVTVTVLSQTMGMAHNQQHMEAYARGLLGTVTLCGKDITVGKWLMKPGLSRSHKSDDPPPALDSSRWVPLSTGNKGVEDSTAGFRWYAIEVDVDLLLDDNDDDEDYARFGIDLSSMTKGQLWINQHHLGRYWLRRAPAKRDYSPCQHCEYGGWFWPDNTCRQKCGEISQQYYHLPRSYLSHGTKNYLFLLEEVGGQPENIVIARRVARILRRPPKNEWVLVTGRVLLAVCGAAALLGLGTVARMAYDKYAARRGYLRIDDDGNE
ncbi:Beta-galactosidase-1-like protein, partial [Coemansia aciculifera]